jgi:hypothetical protein
MDDAHEAGGTEGGIGADAGDSADVPPSTEILRVLPTAGDFGRVVSGGKSSVLSFEVSNLSAVATESVGVMLTGPDAALFAVTDTSCVGEILQPNGRCTLGVQFSPNSPGARMATLVVSGGGMVSVPLSGEGLMPSALSAAPPSGDFGGVPTSGATNHGDIAFKIKNTGTQSSGALATSLGGTDAALFSIVEDTCAGVAVSGGMECGLTVSFRPTSTGGKTATLTVKGMPGGELPVSLTGKGLASEFSIAPAMSTFASLVDVGSTGTEKVHLLITNTGNVAGVATLTVSDSTNFAVTDGCTGAMIVPGAMCYADVVLKPQSAGPQSTTITVANGATGFNVATVMGVGRIPKVTLTLSTGSIARASGTVVPTPMGSSCGNGCFSYDQGQSVTITASGNGSSLFSAWSADCDAQGVPCTLIMSSNKLAKAYFRPNVNIMFVTSTEIKVSTIGPSLTPADAFCVSRAKAGFLGGSNWKAWLSTSAATTNIDASAHVGTSTPGWIRPDGRPFASSMANILAGKLIYPPRVTELNTDQTTVFGVASGTGADGKVKSTGGNCADWTSTTGPVLMGDRSATGTLWNDGFVLGGNACGMTLPLYCFQSDPGMVAVPDPTVPAAARRAFVSKATWILGGGIAAADTLCQGEAASAGFSNPGNYGAMLTTTVAATDPSRFDLSGPPWFRLDGAQLVVAAADLASPAGDKLLTPINVEATGAYTSNQLVWTGSGVAPGVTTATANCSNWTSGSHGLTGWYGDLIATRVFMTQAVYWSNNTWPCDTPAPVYCFER